MMGTLIANRDSKPSYARFLVSGFSANLNWGKSACQHISSKCSSGCAYDGEDIRGLVCDIVKLLAVFRALGITRNDVRGDTGKLIESERNGPLMRTVSATLTPMVLWAAPFLR